MHLLFDIGGTKTRLAFSKDGKSFEDPVIIPTSQDFTKGMAAFKEAAKELIGEERVEVVAGDIAGPLNREHSMLVNAPNLKGWNNKPLRQELERMFLVPVVIENDAATVGLGEAVYGAGKGHDIVAYITVSTGLGGARIVKNRIDVSAVGFEPGHQFIDAAGTLCPECAEPKDLEAYVSGSGVEARHNKKAYEIEDEAVWEELAEWLAYGLNNTIVHWSPDAVVLGGSMIVGDPAIPLQKVEEHLNKIKHIFPKSPPLLKAALEDVGGLWGALVLAQTHM